MEGSGCVRGVRTAAPIRPLASETPLEPRGYAGKALSWGSMSDLGVALVVVVGILGIAGFLGIGLLREGRKQRDRDRD